MTTQTTQMTQRDAAGLMDARPEVASASPWQDRIYLNLYSAKGSFRGDSTAKLWIDAKGVLMVEKGKGTRTDDFDRDFKALVAFAEASGLRVVVR